MNIKPRLPLISLLAALVAFGAGILPGWAQNTAFTYQGQLASSGSPASGLFDMRFQVFNAQSGGASVSSQVTTSAVPVTNGLFVLTLDFGSSPFTGAERWLEVSVRTNGIGSFTTLSPRQSLTPTPYAIYSHIAGAVTNNSVTSAGIASGQVVKSLNGLKDNVAIAAGANVTLTTNANTLQISAPAGGMVLPYSGTAASASSVFTLTNTGSGPAGVFYGNVGVGTATPQTKLDVAGNATVRGGVQLVGVGTLLEFFNPGQSAFRWQSEGDFFSRKFHLIDTTLGSPSYYRMTIDGSGNVGIGTTSPTAQMHIVSPNGNYARLGTTDNGVEGYAGSVEDYGVFGRHQPTGNYGALGLQYAGVYGQHSLSTGSGVKGVHATSGVYGELGYAFRASLMSPQFRAGVYGSSAGSSDWAGLFEGNVKVEGTLTTCVLTITGGCDLAEPFEISEDDIPKGAVVIIDEERPGQLKMSTGEYDKRVAGIISGANGVQPGIVLKQEGTLEGKLNVALTGRVYALADASAGAIRPGDLLTTSSTPGHAMRVADYSKAQGSVIGKAMSSLKEGKGMVLVLVNLQ
jgi:hypothetical protein